MAATNLLDLDYTDLENEYLGFIINGACLWRSLSVAEINHLFERARDSPNIDDEFPLTESLDALQGLNSGLYRMTLPRVDDNYVYTPLYNGIYGSRRTTLSFSLPHNGAHYLGTVCELFIPNFGIFLRRFVYRREIRPHNVDDAAFAGIVFVHYVHAARSLCHGLFHLYYPQYQEVHHHLYP